ncbi:MAG: rhombosortase [Proteobacteria bacterium]|nr:MAG: rhombosortase [Pseudomonadota bacterium]
MITKGREPHDDDSLGPNVPRTTHGARGATGPTGWLLGLAAGGIVLVWLGGPALRSALAYQRQAVLAGECWRLLTGHLVHGSATHLFLNLVGLGLCAHLFRDAYDARQWLSIAGTAALAMAAGFVLFEPQLAWYVGFSGILHGILAAGAVAWWQQRPRLLALALSVLVCAKLAWEQWRGALSLSGDMPVIVDAHLYGAAGGLAAALVIAWRRRGRSRADLQDWPYEP